MKLNRRTLLIALTTAITTNLIYPIRKLNAQSLLERLRANPLPSLKDQRRYRYFLSLANDGNEDYPPLLYWGQKYQNIPFSYEQQKENYPQYLHQLIDNPFLISGTPDNNSFIPYPKLGEIPYINQQGLTFLHSDIKEACLCLETFSEGQLKTQWLGRNALNVGEFWSATKIIPLTYLYSRLSQIDPSLNLNQCLVRDQIEQGQGQYFSLKELAEAVVSYGQDQKNYSYHDKHLSSNALGAMFKRFIPQVELTTWFKSITGNQNIVFQGRYGEAPFIDQPEIFDPTTQKILLNPDKNDPKWSINGNRVSAYDLTRLISLIGWHYYLPKVMRLPNIQENGYDALIPVLGVDPARLIDLGIENLELENQLTDRVVLSKLGNGYTSMRERMEAVYVAFLQVTDQSRNPHQLFSLSLTLRGAIIPRSKSQEDKNQAARQLDARMATEVTQILDRIMNYEL